MAIVIVGLGETYTTLQDAIGNATAGDTIHVAAGIHAENLTVDKELTATVSGTGQPVIQAFSGTADTLADGISGPVSFDGFDLDGQGTAGIGIDAHAGASASLSLVNGAISGFINCDNSSTDNASFDTVTFTGADPVVATGWAGRPDSAVEIIGVLGAPGNANLPIAPSPPIGTGSFADVTVTGGYEKSPVAIFNFVDLDGIAGEQVDASEIELVFPASYGGPVTELQGEKRNRNSGAVVDTTITGTAGEDCIHGKDRDDTLIGGDGNDILYGSNKPGQDFDDGAGDLGSFVIQSGVFEDTAPRFAIGHFDFWGRLQDDLNNDQSTSGPVDFSGVSGNTFTDTLGTDANTGIIDNRSGFVIETGPNTIDGVVHDKVLADVSVAADTTIASTADDALHLLR